MNTELIVMIAPSYFTLGASLSPGDEVAISWLPSAGRASVPTHPELVRAPPVGFQPRAASDADRR
eukprot:COSAG06_NODE_46068_length_349_cov_5.596000_2_plen_64_part_01